MNFKQLSIKLAVLALVSAGVVMFQSTSSASSVGIMSIATLAHLLDNPNVVILDVRTGRDWSSSTQKIKGAVRAAPSKFESWSGQYAKEQKIVLYCA